jgi:hypothetical protein
VLENVCGFARFNKLQDTTILSQGCCGSCQCLGTSIHRAILQESGLCWKKDTLDQLENLLSPEGASDDQRRAALWGPGGIG